MDVVIVCLHIVGLAMAVVMEKSFRVTNPFEFVANPLPTSCKSVANSVSFTHNDYVANTFKLPASPLE